MSYKKLIPLVLFFYLLITSITLSAERLISYQGKVFDNAGNPVNEMSVSVTVKFYNAESGGSLLGNFIETHNVNIVNGFFNINVGSKTQTGVPSTIFNTGSAVYLSISIHNEEQLPRPKIVYVPYTLTSYGKEINCIDYPGTVDAGYYCIDQDWSADMVVLPYDAQKNCQARGMHTCSWFEYSYACVKYKNGLLQLYNIVHTAPGYHQHTSEFSFTTFRAWGHRLGIYPDPSCFMDAAAVGGLYYRTSPAIHYRCCIKK
jgi:hypothetical protein